MAATAPSPELRVQARPITSLPNRQWRWLLAGAVVAFLVPFVFTDLITLDRDLYYGILIASVFGFVSLWLRLATDGPPAVLTRNWRRGLVLGLLFGAAMVAIVLREPATSHPHGLDFALAIVWRGVLYGLADGILLSAFPIVAAFTAFAGKRILERRRGKAVVGALALAVSMLFTAVYHLGYADFRGEKLRKPLAGDVVWSVPTLVTLSPIASPLTHAALHVSAVVHSSDTDTFLPPHATSLDTASLQAVLDGLVGGPDRIAPGATAYVSGPAGTWSGAAGFADLETLAPMPVDARMRLESVSKAWTAALILRLVAEGRVGLDDRVARWLPGLLPAGDRITVRQLLNHTSGLIDNNDIQVDAVGYLARVEDPVLRARLLRVGRALERNPSLEFSPRRWIEFAAALPLLSEPGERYHYSNIGYEIAGLVAERAAGRPLGRLYREEIVEPLELRSAAYDPQGPIAGRHARGYAMDVPPVDRTDAHGGVGAEGGIVADAEDEARFLTALMRGELLPPRELRALRTPPPSSVYALGLVLAPSGCAGLAFTHSGGGAAYKTGVWVSADGAQVAVLLTNGRSADSDRRVDAAVNRLFCSVGEEDR
jgi:D-alanyl-D-alanine carboxypeptidase